MKRLSLTALLEREDDGYAALCPEPDVVSQGQTIEESMANLKEAVELFLGSASHQEIERRLRSDLIIGRFEAVYA
jgi:predicted RNase H-like HicB family nuclease